MSIPKRWTVVAAYAAAMAWVEAAVVFYLRTMVDRIEPYQTDPLPFASGFAVAELVREAATLIMLLMVGILAGKTWRTRLGFAAIAFGFWDIFYYVFLKVLCGWPHSFLDWDILFLLPMPWWGPVLAPVSVAGLMIVWGTLASGCEDRIHAQSAERRFRLHPNVVRLLSCLGIALALYAFMADNIRVSSRGVDAWRTMLPTRFQWRLFFVAFVLMSVPVIHLFWRIARPQVERIRAVASPNK
jgi:hypothetical protein